MRGASPLLWYLLVISSLPKDYGIQDQKPHYIIPAQPQAESAENYERAQQFCKQNGQLLPSMASLGDHQLLTKQLSEGRKTSTWLNIKRQTLGSWTWVDGTTSELLENIKVRGCGFIDYTSPFARATECSALWLGHVCQRRGKLEHCQDLHVGLKQVKAGKGCYVIHMEKVTWFEARTRCFEKNMDLAVIKDLTAQLELRRKLTTYWAIFEQYHFWIGLRNTDWKLLGASKDTLSMFWDYGEPQSTGDCVRAVKSKDMYAWKTTPCAEKHQFVCVESTGATVTKENTSTMTKSLQTTTSRMMANSGRIMGRSPSRSSVNGLLTIAEGQTVYFLVAALTALMFGT